MRTSVKLSISPGAQPIRKAGKALSCPTAKRIPDLRTKRSALRGLAALSALALLSTGCFRGMMNAAGAVYVRVQNASSVPVCEVNIWGWEDAKGATEQDINWLHDSKIAPGEKRLLGAKKSAVPLHFRAKTCSGAVLTEQMIDLHDDALVLVH